MAEQHLGTTLRIPTAFEHPAATPTRSWGVASIGSRNSASIPGVTRDSKELQHGPGLTFVAITVSTSIWTMFPLSRDRALVDLDLARPLDETVLQVRHRGWQ